MRNLSSSLFLFAIIFFVSCAPSRIQTKKIQTYQAKPKTTYYFVKRGDSLWKISKIHGVSVKKIMEINKTLFPKSLKVGQKILIPQTNKRATRINFSWPTEGKVITYFGDPLGDTINNGLNIKATGSQAMIKAAAQGQIVFSDYLKGWGQTIIIKHPEEFYTVYANLSNALVKEGKSIQNGQPIGKIISGKNTDPVLYFEVRKRYIPQNPLKYLN